MEIQAYIGQYPGNMPVNTDGLFPLPVNLRNWFEEREEGAYSGRVTLDGKEYDHYTSVDTRIGTWADKDGVEHQTQVIWTYLVDKDGRMAAMMNNGFTVTFSIKDDDPTDG